MSEVAGEWYDGQASRPRPVRLSRTPAGDIRIVAGHETLELPPQAIAISPRLGRTPRILRLAGCGQIECPDSPELDRWFAAPSRVEAFADWLERRRTAAVAAALVTVLGVVAFFRWGLPAASAWLAPRVPPAVERAMSSNAMALLDRIGLRPTRLPAARREALQGQFRTLVRELPRERDMRLEFRHAPGFGANAFALPDGRLLMTDQLVALANNDEELLAVLAHEAGHHEHRHALRQTIESSGILVMGALLFGDVSGNSLGVSLPTVLLESGFSRGHESEADEFALRLLLRQGHSPQAFADILRRLSKEHGGDGPQAIGYLSTHPPTQERIERAERAARP